MRARIRKELCIGCGHCEEWSEQVFEVRGHTAIVRKSEVPPMEEGFCIDAMWTCPRAAIQLKGLLGGLFKEWTSADDDEAIGLELTPKSARAVEFRIEVEVPSEPKHPTAVGIGHLREPTHKGGRYESEGRQECVCGHRAL